MSTSPAQALTLLRPEDVDFYRENGYLVLRQVVPDSLLSSLQVPIEKWVETKIQEWRQEGRIQSDYRHSGFTTRLAEAWQAAGRPVFNPNPTVEIVGRELYDCLRFPLFIRLAQDLFQSPNIRANGVFHCRPDLPHQSLTDTPWHQDAQCCQPLAGTRFLIVWIPLVDVDASNGALEMAPGLHRRGLYKTYKHPDGHYISMRPGDVENLGETRVITMKRGDVLCFNEMIPHRAVPNLSSGIRWSVDIRYSEASEKNLFLPKRAFVCAHEDPSRIEDSYEHWVERMHLPVSNEE